MADKLEKAKRPVLRIRGLCASRGYRVLFRELELEVHAGNIVELRGPNGSGKSTLLRILAGLTRPAAGSIDWAADDAPADGGDASNLHYLGHLDGVKSQETALQQALFWARFLGGDPAQVKPVLERVGLSRRLDVPGRGLSAGQKRRLALSRLLTAPRKVWLLDEPLAALDMDGQAIVRELITEHCDQGGVVITAMHGAGFDRAKTVDLSDFAPRGREAAA